MFIQYNSNPFDVNDDDCAIRAISIITEKSWETVYMDLVVLGITKGRMPTNKSVCNSYLKSLDFIREVIGHDEAKAELVNKLRSMEMNAENEEQRKMIRHWISQAEEN